MARFLSLGRAASLFLPGTFGALGALAASAATTNAPPAKIPVPPPLVDNDFSRYGKILAPNDRPVYPFKLTMPIPGFGEVRIPGKEELDMREKLERLATLSDADIRTQLEKWPAFSKMSLGDEGAMLTRIQQFRDFRSKMALQKAHQLGLLTLNPDQQARFEKEFWDRRLQMDRELSQELEPIFKIQEQKLDEGLYKEFSSPASLAKKPPAPPIPKPAAPIATMK